MAKIQQFEELNSWKKGRLLIKEVYQITSAQPFYKDYALRDQMRRAVISISANIAEGFERGSNKEFIYFLSIAKASCGEVRSLLYPALDLGYIDKSSFHAVRSLSLDITKLLGGHIKYLKSSNYKGYRKKS